MAGWPNIGALETQKSIQCVFFSYMSLSTL